MASTTSVNQHHDAAASHPAVLFGCGVASSLQNHEGGDGGDQGHIKRFL